MLHKCFLFACFPLRCTSVLKLRAWEPKELQKCFKKPEERSAGAGWERGLSTRSQRSRFQPRAPRCAASSGLPAPPQPAPPRSWSGAPGGLISERGKEHGARRREGGGGGGVSRRGRRGPSSLLFQVGAVPPPAGLRAARRRRRRGRARMRGSQDHAGRLRAEGGSCPQC